MDFKGSIYHPKFMNFDISLEVSPQQEKEKSESISGSNQFRDSYLSRYHVSSNFLQDKPYNFTLFTNKLHEVRNRDFFERQIVDKSGYGGTLRLREVVFPLRISFSRSDEEIDRSFRATQDFEEEIITVYGEPEITPLGKIRMDYTRDKFLRSEEGTSDQKGTSHSLGISNMRYFGDFQDVTLNSYLRYYSLEGDRNSEDISLNESLAIKHSESLETFYRYNFNDRSSQNTDTTQHNMSAGLRHKLYESLTTSFNLRGSYLESTSFDEGVAGFSITEDYRKKIGVALLRLGAGYDYEIEKRKSRDTFLYIVDETHTLTDGTVTYLNEARIDTSTIAVTNSSGTISYTQDTDYQIIELADGRVEIRRIAGGDISNGDEVLVDYIVRRNPSFKFATAENNLRCGVDFWEDVLRFYYNLRQQRYSDIEGERNLVLQKLDNTVFGSELRFGGIDLSVEYEDYETDLTPYNALRLRQGVRWNLSPRSNFTLRSTQNYVDYTDGKRKNYDLRGNYSLRLSRSAVCNAESGYRWQRGQDVDLKNFTSRVTYRIYVGALFFEVGYEYEKERSLGDYLQSHYVYTKLRREF